jgi:hypothetical protein
MKYRWMICPGCGCEAAINYTETSAGTFGSVRRWNHDRTINDGKAFQIAGAERAADAAFTVECRCGRTLEVPARPDAVSAEREANMRVDLGE